MGADGWLDDAEMRAWLPLLRVVQHVVLTQEGTRVLEATAPGHVAEVRRLVFDQLDVADVAHLRRVAEKLLVALQPWPPRQRRPLRRRLLPA